MIFLDSSFTIALQLEDDQNHPAARAAWKEVVQSGELLTTTSYVFDEVVTFLNTRRRHDKATQIGAALLESPAVEFVHVDQQLFHQGWLFFGRHHDKTYSLTDCISFLVMEERRITHALTFDGHFRQAGFLVVP